MTLFILPLSDQLKDIANSLGSLAAEGFLVAGFLVLLLAEIGIGCRLSAAKRRRWLAGITLATLGLAFIAASSGSVRGTYLFLHFLFLDDQAVFFKQLIAISAVVVVLWESTARQRPSLPVEWYALLLSLVLGLYLMTMATNLLGIYLSIELVSISSYLLTALTKGPKAAEGGLKYLLFGAVSSAIMLYGMSLLYGMSGTLDLTAPDFTDNLARSGGVLVTLAGLLTLAGLFFKLSLVPFHVWTPDAYEAAPVPVAAFFSAGPKVAALLVLLRIISALPGDFQIPLAVVALASITLGNLSALVQTDAKRLLAYSTIAQAGFLLVGVVAFSKSGFEAATFYIATYLPMTLAAFFLIDSLSTDPNGALPLSALRGLGRQHPWLSVGLTVVMIGLTGLPPTVGFTAKLLAFSALYEAYQQSGNTWLLTLFGLGLLNAVVSLFYYLKIPYLLFFRQTDTPGTVPKDLSSTQTAVLLMLVGLVLWLFFQPGWLLSLIADL